MAQWICELIWIKIILTNLGITLKGPMRLYCDNQAAINISHNPIHHDLTKHVEIDWHFIKEKLDNGLICPLYTPSSKQLADILTKGLPSSTFLYNLRQDRNAKYFCTSLRGSVRRIGHEINNYFFLHIYMISPAIFLLSCKSLPMILVPRI